MFRCTLSSAETTGKLVFFLTPIIGLTWSGWLSMPMQAIAGFMLMYYVLMSNHVHLLISAHEAGAPGILMKALGQRHAQYMNWRYRRSGSLWDGRYKACLIQDERYLLVCQRYFELNPVRARMVDFPAQYRRSSYRCNAEGRADRLVCPHPAYLELGADAAARRQAYRALFQHALAPDFLDYIRASANGNAALNGQEFLRWAAGKKTKPEA